MTERKRATGFVLMDAAFTADAKFVRLARGADPVAFAACVGVWWMLLADCRRAKSPAIDWDDYTEYTDQITQLRSAHLLNEGGFEREAFDRWAPAYKSPSERTPPDPTVPDRPSGTESTQSTQASGQLVSGQVTSQATEGGVGGTSLPDEDDSVTLACRMFLEGGKWLADEEYVAAWEDMDHRYSPAWVQEELTPAYAAVLEKRGKVQPWDLRRMVDLRCAERNRRAERERVAGVHQRELELAAAHRKEIEEATPEQREQAELQKQAIRIGIELNLAVPTEPGEVKKFVMKYGSAA